MSRLSHPRSSELDPRVGAALGGLAAVVLSAALVPLRDDIATPALALLLVLPVLLGAVTGGRFGGAVAAVIATMGFDFFLTRPYLSLTIDSRDDVETAALFLVVALVVGTVAAGAHRSSFKAQQGRIELESIHRVAEMVANDDSAKVIEAARKELIRVLHLDACEFDRGSDRSALPVLEHSGALQNARLQYVPGGFVLPSGVELRVTAQGRQFGRFVLHGRPGVAVTTDARLAAVVIADQVAASLATDRSKREEQA